MSGATSPGEDADAARGRGTRGGEGRDESFADARRREWREGLLVLAELSAREWTDALGGLGRACEDLESDEVAARMKSAAPSLALYAKRLLGEAVGVRVRFPGYPPRETGELYASRFWTELGPAKTAILADRLHALLSAPWVAHRGEVKANSKVWAESIPH